jgi:hypothetical protein
MSHKKQPNRTEHAEETIHSALKQEFRAKRAQIREAGFISELDPIHRSGSGQTYSSYIEAALWYAEGGLDVHDIFYIPIAENGLLIVDSENAIAGFKEDLAESLTQERW